MQGWADLRNFVRRVPFGRSVLLLALGGLVGTLGAAPAAAEDLPNPEVRAAGPAPAAPPPSAGPVPSALPRPPASRHAASVAPRMAPLGTRQAVSREAALSPGVIRRGCGPCNCDGVPARSLCGFVEDYVPFMPTPESRSAWTSLTTVPTPFGLTAGEADTPCCGMLRASVQRISDERSLQDLNFNSYRSDGEVRTISLEYVSPAIRLPVGRRGLRAHLSLSGHMYTRNFALFDRLRNVVEEHLLDADQAVLDAHDIGGSELEIERANGTIEEVLDSRPMFKVRGAFKVHLPRMRVFQRPLQTAVSLGITSPAFGNFEASANDSPLFDVTFAYAMPLTSCLRLQGATFVSTYDDVDLYNSLGVQQADLAVGSTLNLEWWVTNRFAASLGVSWNSAVWEDTGLPMDLDSWYFQIGLLGRLTKKVDVYLVWAENPDTRIIETRGADFSDSQKDADFTFLLGTRIRF